MPTLLEYQLQFKEAINNAPDFLKAIGTYTYNTKGASYDPETDSYTGSTLNSVDIICLKGVDNSGGSNATTFTTGTEAFTVGKPSVNAELVMEGESWNIISISSDPIGLTYTFTVENKDGI